MTNKPNMADPTPDDIRNFVVAVVGIAVADHYAKAPVKSGKQLVDMTTCGRRGFHRRMSTGIYNSTRASLECAGQP